MNLPEYMTKLICFGPSWSTIKRKDDTKMLKLFRDFVRRTSVLSMHGLEEDELFIMPAKCVYTKPVSYVY